MKLLVYLLLFVIAKTLQHELEVIQKSILSNNGKFDLISNNPSNSYLKHINLEQSSLTIGVTSIYSSQYQILLDIGTPSRELSLLVDTQWPLTWLPTADCKCGNFATISKDESTTLDFENTQISINYTQGSVSGYLASDIFISKSENFTHKFLAVDKKEGFEWLVSDGVLGLGLGDNSLITTLYNEGIIKGRIFGIFLSRNEESKKSKLLIGDADQDEYSSLEGISMDVKSLEKWEVEWEYYKINNTTYNKTIKTQINPGEQYLIGPEELVKIIIDQINATGFCHMWYYNILVCPEGKNITYPSLLFGFLNNTVILMPGSYTSNSTNNTYILIQSHKEDYWIFGQPFVKEYFPVFNMDSKKIMLYKINYMNSLSLVIYVIVSIFVIVVILVPVIVYCFISKSTFTNDELSDSLIR
ncbi:hypothetical protein SteCoe_16977 [Stentor coeruleus]|uniref:Peptidase A1 domain-containing protein n=1 Tax=Stentor coeruleus TaxID=5963 RepID=A0A1R2C009_9CILI|nr:hypothetical protein SteCoe_16977 [Stentor coeruleus]